MEISYLNYLKGKDGRAFNIRDFYEVDKGYIWHTEEDSHFYNFFVARYRGKYKDFLCEDEFPEYIQKCVELPFWRVQCDFPDFKYEAKYDERKWYHKTRFSGNYKKNKRAKVMDRLAKMSDITLAKKLETVLDGIPEKCDEYDTVHKNLGISMRVYAEQSILLIRKLGACYLEMVAVEEVRMWGDHSFTASKDTLEKVEKVHEVLASYGEEIATVLIKYKIKEEIIMQGVSNPESIVLLRNAHSELKEIINSAIVAYVNVVEQLKL